MLVFSFDMMMCDFMQNKVVAMTTIF